MKVHIYILVALISVLSLHAQPGKDSAASELSSYLGWDGILVEQPTIIKGRISGIHPDSLQVKIGSIIYNHLLGGDQVIHHYEITDSGNFHIVFPLIRPQEIMFKFDDFFGSVYAVPGKTTSFILDITKNKEIEETYQREARTIPDPLVFDGDLAEFNTHYTQIVPLLQQAYNFFDNKKNIESMDQMAYKEARMAGREAQLESLAIYANDHEVPEAIQDYFEARIKFSACNDLMRYRWLKRSKTNPSEIKLTQEYRSFINAKNLNDPNGLLTDDYSYWMHELNVYMYEFVKTDNIKIFNLLDSINALKKENEDFLLKIDEIGHERDTNQIRTMQNEYRDSVMKSYNDRIRMYLEQRTYKDEVAIIADILPPGIGRDIVSARHFLAQISRPDTLSKEQWKEVDQLMQNNELKEYLRDANEAIADLDEEAMPDKVIVAPKLYNQGDSLFQAMMKPHLGKVVYVDFWAPWCGPCMSEIRHSGTLKKELDGKKVLYYCICINCKKESWERAIKKYNISGEHYLTDDRESSLLSERYQITGIPRYMLIGPEGKVVNKDALRPSQVGAVKAAVLSLLEVD